jgi:hypothetical protein
MNKVIQSLNWLLRQVTTISEWTFKLPAWLIKLIFKFVPNGKEILEKIESYRTVLANVLTGALAFMEAKDWTAIGEMCCQVLNFIFGLANGWFGTHWVCDPSWFPAIAVILVTMMNIALRKITTGPIAKSLK